MNPAPGSNTVCYWHERVEEVRPLFRQIPRIPERPREGWREGANCADMDQDLFVPPRPNTIAPVEVIVSCATCPVRGDCLRYGLREEFGFWGGLGARDRENLRRRLRRRDAA